MKEKVVKEKKKKKKLSRSAIVLIIALIIIAIPCSIFGYILISASMKTGTPIMGDRFKNDLNPTISETSRDSIVSSVSRLNNVEKCEIVMTSAQLRINIDTNDAISKDEMLALADEIYEIVDDTLPVKTYFTIQASGAKMYDLSINLYNYIAKADDENFKYYVLTKNSKMEEKEGQFVSEAVSPELAKELRGETTAEEPSAQ